MVFFGDGSAVRQVRLSFMGVFGRRAPARASHSRKIKKKTKHGEGSFENYRKGTKAL